MAKAELRDHRKFLKLKRLLAEPVPHLVGYLELLWLRGYQTGKPYVGDADDVESAAEYPGERGKFAAAAFEAGFLDRDGDAYTIHDLYDHAPEYARKRMKRRGTADNGGQCPPNGNGNNKTASVRPETAIKAEGKAEKELNPPNPPAGGLDIGNELYQAIAAACEVDPIAGRSVLAGPFEAMLAAGATPQLIQLYRLNFHRISPTARKEGREVPYPNELKNGFRKAEKYIPKPKQNPAPKPAPEPDDEIKDWHTETLIECRDKMRRPGANYIKSFLVEVLAELARRGIPDTT